MSKNEPRDDCPNGDEETTIIGDDNSNVIADNSISRLRTLILEDNILERNTCKMVIPSEVHSLIPQCRPNEVIDTVEYSALVKKLRYTPLCVCIEMLKYGNFSMHVKELLPRIITKVDMITDCLSLYWLNNIRKGGRAPLSNPLKRGLARSFNNFDEQDYASREGNENVTISDAICLVHPKARTENEANLFRAIASGRLIVIVEDKRVNNK
jgi:60 kDa SS-A/Ro ribonucleoprotein